MSKFGQHWESVFFSPWSAGALLALVAAAYVLAHKDFLVASSIRRLVSATGAFAAGLLVVYLIQSIGEMNVMRERNVERIALETREHDLSTKALVVTGLACVDSLGNDLIETSCEKVLFSGPREITAAVSYTSARVALFVAEYAYAKYDIDAFKHSRAAVKRAAERDRFGLYAHVLTAEYGCSQTECDFFKFMQDPARLKANLRERVFDSLLNRYAVSWVDPPLPQTTGSPQAATQSPQRAMTKRGLDLPSANGSIPPVSIMAPEPAVSRAAAPPPEAGRQNNPVASGPPHPRETRPQNILPGNQ